MVPVGRLLTSEDRTHDLFAFPSPVFKVDAAGLGFSFPPGFLCHEAAHAELPTLCGICRWLRCGKSQVRSEREGLTDVSTGHMS